MRVNEVGFSVEDLENMVNKKNVFDYSFSNFLEKSKQGDSMKKLFGNFIYEGDLCILAGKTGVGKSILAYQLADGIAKGTNVLNQKNECGAKIVLHFDFELREQNIKQRFFDFEPSVNHLRPDVKMILGMNDGRFDFETIRTDLDNTKAALLIIDNIDAIALRVLSDQQHSLDFMRQAWQLRNDYNLTILLIAHTPKLRETRELDLYDISGSSKIHNFLDSALIINRSCKDINERYIKAVKSRNSETRDDVDVLQINSFNWLHYDYIGTAKETSLLNMDSKTVVKKQENLKDLAKLLYPKGTEQYTYSDLCKKIMKFKKCSVSNSKLWHSKLKRAELIEKDAQTWFLTKPDKEDEPF